MDFLEFRRRLEQVDANKLLGRFSIFSDAPSNFKLAIFQCMHYVKNLYIHTVLKEYKENVDGLYLIKSGTIKLLHRTGSKDIEVGIRDRGSSLMEEYFSMRNKASIYKAVVASFSSEIYYISFKQLKRILSEFPQEYLKFISLSQNTLNYKVEREKQLPDKGQSPEKLRFDAVGSYRQFIAEQKKMGINQGINKYRDISLQEETGSLEEIVQYCLSKYKSKPSKHADKSKPGILRLPRQQQLSFLPQVSPSKVVSSRARSLQPRGFKLIPIKSSSVKSPKISNFPLKNLPAMRSLTERENPLKLPDLESPRVGSLRKRVKQIVDYGKIRKAYLQGF